MQITELSVDESGECGRKQCSNVVSHGDGNEDLWRHGNLFTQLDESRMSLGRRPANNKAGATSVAAFKDVEDTMLAQDRGHEWTDMERRLWKFRLIFFIVYTLFSLVNFLLVYNMYNYIALVLQIVNLSFTYLLLLTLL